MYWYAYVIYGVIPIVIWLFVPTATIPKGDSRTS